MLAENRTITGGYDAEQAAITWELKSFTDLEFGLSAFRGRTFRIHPGRRSHDLVSHRAP